jgi:hypothetical protein
MGRLGGAMASGVAGSAGFAGGPKPGVPALAPMDQRISTSGERLVQTTRTIRHHSSIGKRRRRAGEVTPNIITSDAQITSAPTEPQFSLS